MTLGLLPPIAPGSIDPVSLYLARILETQPWLTLEIEQNILFFRGHEGNISISTDIKKWDVWWYLWLIDLSQSQVWYKVQMLNLPFGLIWFASNLGQFLKPNYFRTLVVCWCHKAWYPTVPAPLSSASRGWEEVFRWQKLLLVGSPRRTRSHGKALELKKHLATFNK